MSYSWVVVVRYHGRSWVARGGNHFNWYMFYGGYNRGRTASANVMK